MIDTRLGPLHAEVRGHADAPAALLWPSLFADHSMWAQQVPVLHQNGWRTIALDPPGHGKSPGIGRTFTMDECAEAALEVLEAISPSSPVLLLGTSWGGFVAPRIALRAPDRVRGMVLFATSADQPTLFERLRARLLVTLFSASVFDSMINRMVINLMLAPSTLRDRPGLGADLAQRFRSWDRVGMATTIRSVLVERDAVLDKLAGIAAPTLLISGPDDKLLPASHSERMASRLANAQHIAASRGAHLIPVEAPDLANGLVVDFLGRLRA